MYGGLYMKKFFSRFVVCIFTFSLLISTLAPCIAAVEPTAHDYVIRLQAETGKSVLDYEYDDFDGNSTFEMFAFVGEKSADTDDGCNGDIYYVTADKSTKVVRGVYSWDDDAIEVFQICGVNFIAVDAVPGNYVDTKIFTVADGECELTNISEISSNRKRKVDDNTLGVLSTEFDGMYDGTRFLSRAEKYYYFFWDAEAKEFKEYGGIKITQEQFSTLDGAAEILALFDKTGYKKGDIYFRKNGIINFNYTHSDPGDDSGVYYCDSANIRYDGQSCKLIEGNDWNDDELARSSYGGLYHAALSNNAVYPEAFPETIYDEPAVEPVAVPSAEEISAKLIVKPTTEKIKYGYTLELSADTSVVPEGTHIMWSIDGKGFEMSVSEDGIICSLESVAKGKATVTAKIVDADGNTVTDSDGNELVATQNLTSKAGIFRKVAAFFRKLFNSNMTIR